MDGILPAPADGFVVDVPLAIVGSGACGMVAALTARDAGVEPLLIERDAVPSGSTALSSGMIVGAGTRLQKAAGVDDRPELLIADIQKKNGNRGDPAIVRAVAEMSGPAVDWLTGTHGVDLTLVEGFLYPGMSRLRMHAPPSRTGAALMGSLETARLNAGIELLTEARVTDLFADGDGKVVGLRIARPDGSIEDIGCAALILACNGYGGNPAMVAAHIPEMAGATYFGHTGNQGDAVRWGRALGAGLRHMSGYQGHGSVAHPHGILITWALMAEGGFQVNAEGKRYANENTGYSEMAVPVLRQPGGVAWDVYDARLHELGLAFEDYRNAEAMGAVKRGDTIAELAQAAGLPAGALAATIASVRRMAEGKETDPFGRDFSTRPPLEPPWYAIKVTGALFHTQGGLTIDAQARVLRTDGKPLPNLFAAGGAACGVSGPEAPGYLSGNGLLTAVTLGRIAGREAARLLGAAV